MQVPSILYVDDEQNNLDAFKAAFRRHYQIHTAISALEALKILGKFPVQVIISDQRMPEITGTEFFEAVLQSYPDAIRIILTGYSDMEPIIKAINTCRIFRYLTKPWNVNELKEVIDLALMTYAVEHKNKELLLHLQKKVQDQNHLIQELAEQNRVLNTTIETTESEVGPTSN